MRIILVDFCGGHLITFLTALAFDPLILSGEFLTLKNTGRGEKHRSSIDTKNASYSPSNLPSLLTWTQ